MQLYPESRHMSADVLLFRSGTSCCGDSCEGEIGGTSRESSRTGGSWASPEELAQVPTHKRIDGIRQKSYNNERHSQNKRLECSVVRPGIYELWQEGKEEDCDLWIENIDKDTLGEDAMERLWLGFGLSECFVPGGQCLDTDPSQIRDPCPFDDCVGIRRTCQKKSESCHCSKHMECRTEVHTSRRRQPYALP